MKNYIIKLMKTIRKEDGVTLVENLVALALITAVIVPSALFMTKLANNQRTKDLDTAVHLCQYTIEYTIADKDYSSKQWEVQINNKYWLIERKVEIDEHLVQINVYAKPHKQKDWKGRLYLCRYQN